MIINKMASSVDPDEMAHYEPSHLDLHCLNRYLRRSSVERVNACIALKKNHFTRTFFYLHSFRILSLSIRNAALRAVGTRWLSRMCVRLVIRRLRVRPPPSWQDSFVVIDHEIFSAVILSLPLIQGGQLSFSGKRMCTVRVNRIED